MKTKDTWEKVKGWVKEHKTAIVIGTATVITGAIGVILIGKTANAQEKEGQEIVDVLTEAQEWDGETGDRYAIDKDTIKKLPAGTYDVFDMYENERVDFIVE